MNRCLVFLLVSVFLCSSCAIMGKMMPERGISPQETAGPSLEEVFDSGHWITMPSNTGVTLMGIAGRRSNRKEAIAEALADAARRAALYHGVRGESASVLNQGSGNLDYFSDFDYRLNLLHNTEEYINALVFDQEKDVLEKNGAVFVRVQYPGVSGFPAYNSVIEDGTPDWVKNYGAEIPGFLTAVSFSKNRGSPQRTYQASYESAIVSLLPQLSTRMANEVIDVGGGTLSQNYTVSSGTLEGVIILETWVDKKTGAIWTLLVARQKL
ncbi:MAG: hypothetical protein LBL28_08490 [Treponema sp.]|nr:hypothetical protein [Treponema sp.]